ncbi:MAG: winged helix-turn-helix domain-containing protein [Acidobacteriota bacterium]|nr:winged helix-turn-helix domain-containing protein [Acidobacteriota bacterium]
MELSASGFKAYYVETLSSALGVTAQWQFDATLVDAYQLENEISGVVNALRAESQMPILAILRSDEEGPLLNLLAAGATQVLPHSPSPRVIAAQLHRLVEVSRPRSRDDAGRVKVGPLWLNPRRAVGTVDGVDVQLTASEFELLLLLASEVGELVHRDTISRTLRFGTATERRRSADMHISRIRRKLKAAGGERIEVVTVYGKGYLLQLAPEKTSAPEAPRIEWTV